MFLSCFKPVLEPEKGHDKNVMLNVFVIHTLSLQDSTAKKKNGESTSAPKPKSHREATGFLDATPVEVVANIQNIPG